MVKLSFCYQPKQQSTYEETTTRNAIQPSRHQTGLSIQDKSDWMKNLATDMEQKEEWTDKQQFLRIKLKDKSIRQLNNYREAC